LPNRLDSYLILSLGRRSIAKEAGAARRICPVGQAKHNHKEHNLLTVYSQKSKYKNKVQGCMLSGHVYYKILATISFFIKKKAVTDIILMQPNSA